MTCHCASTPCSCGPAASVPCVTPSPTNTPAPANTQPLTSLACTPLGSLQGIVDIGRRIAHQVGARPYRVRLVWQEQDPNTAKWSEVAGMELVPVVADLGGHRLEDLAGGQVPGGSIRLTQVSPAQVDEHTLRGYLDGKPWSSDNPTREFFFEVQQLRRCEGDPEPERYRFALDGVPELKTDRFEWRVSLVSQFGRRNADGTDSTVPGEIWEVAGARLVP